MIKEYMGINAVTDLFDIIDENYVTKQDFENREKVVASAVCVGSALIAKSLLKVAEAIIAAKGEEGGEGVSEMLIASAAEVDEVLSKYFSGSPVEQSEKPSDDDKNAVDESQVATSAETNNVLNQYFN